MNVVFLFAVVLDNHCLGISKHTRTAFLCHTGEGFKGHRTEPFLEHLVVKYILIHHNELCYSLHNASREGVAITLPSTDDKAQNTA